MLKLESFFGLLIDEDVSHIQPLLDVLKVDAEIRETKVVKTLSKQNGRNASIVNVAIRQQLLKLIKPLLNEDMLDYQENYYTKEVNTSSNHDRRYGSEEKLLEFALLIASTQSQKSMTENSNMLTVKQLREAAFLQSRFDRCWDILAKESEHTVAAYRKSK